MYENSGPILEKLQYLSGWRISLSMLENPISALHKTYQQIGSGL